MRKSDIKGEFDLLKFPSHLMYLREYNKNRFPYFGVYCFCGKQGSGKTLTAVRMITNILRDFNDIYVITNIDLNYKLLGIDPDNIIKFERYYQMFIVYDKPVIYLIDEAHLLFNSLNSKNCDVSLFNVISQNRKCQRVFILTSQVFGRLEKFMREQIDTIIPCKTYFHYFTRCVVYRDFEKDKDNLVGHKAFSVMYTHNKDIHYKMYDTSQIIDYSKDSPFYRTIDQDKADGLYDKYFFKETFKYCY